MRMKFFTLLYFQPKPSNIDDNWLFDFTIVISNIIVVLNRSRVKCGVYESSETSNKAFIVHS